MAVIRTGLVGAVVLSAGAVLFAVLGLSPSLRWIPEIPLLTVGALSPVAVCALTGYLAARTGGVRAGVGAGAIAGAAGGVTGGVAYLVFGKSMVNVAVGLVLGLAGGGILGLAGAWLHSILAPLVRERSPGPRSRS